MTLDPTNPTVVAAALDDDDDDMPALKEETSPPQHVEYSDLQPVTDLAPQHYLPSVYKEAIAEAIASVSDAGTPLKATISSRRTIAGMRPWVFWCVVGAVGLVVIGLAVGGAVGGSMAVMGRGNFIVGHIGAWNFIAGHIGVWNFIEDNTKVFIIFGAIISGVTSGVISGVVNYPYRASTSDGIAISREWRAWILIKNL
ncbi:hypothetical protein DM02DRAFT_652099 [Periconia macrospinosa]|uniref:Uncharacterized protein n=1 Tax=Periconia macrospinosa TaxID=97972 RepID=A0A2V1E357_9PLEO|nr:hypothetical protein DM02DRAFT_652099 [Periconia macrospinosa]